MSASITVDEIVLLAQQLSSLDKLKVIQRLAPELEADLVSTPIGGANAVHALDEQYQRGYELIPEDLSLVDAMFPHLPLKSEPWK